MTLDLILLALAISLDPLPLSAYILLLGSRNGTAKGWAFIAGWTACLVLVIAVVLVLTGGKPLKPNSTPTTLALVLRVAAGLALLALAWRQRRNSGRPRKRPRWESKLDDVGILAAAGIAPLLQPWAMIAAGGATMAQADLAARATIAVLVAFCVLGTISYATMQIGASLRPQATRARLEALNQWLDDHRDSALIALYVVVGLWLIGKGVYLLA